jgi:Ca2+-binding EF-hand superfamily protein
MPKADVAAIFSAADVNHDGRLTFEEARSYSFLVTEALFDQCDTDSSGYVDRAEAGLPPVDIDFAQLFDDADKNGDGWVTFPEAYESNHLITQSQFNSYDTNQDGYLGRAEVGLPPADPGKVGCEGCSSGGGKSWPAGGDLFTLALGLLGLAVMAGVARP